MDSAELIARAKQRDPDAWATLAANHQQAVFRYAYLILGDPDDAADIAQETFIRAYHALHQFESTRPMRPWLMRIAANLSRNRLRSATRYVAAVQRWWRGEPQHALAPQLDDQQALWQAVRRLSEADQQIIYLRYFLDMSEAEAAQTLAVAQGTVKSRTHRAINRLRRIVLSEYPSLREMFD